MIFNSKFMMDRSQLPKEEKGGVELSGFFHTLKPVSQNRAVCCFDQNTSKIFLNNFWKKCQLVKKMSHYVPSKSLRLKLKVYVFF